MVDASQGNGAAPESGGGNAAASVDSMAVLAAAQQALAQLEAMVETGKQRVAELLEAATTAAAAKTKIADDQAVIATKSDHIQSAQDHADKVRGELDRVLTAATQDATAAEGLHARAQTAADGAAEVLGEVKVHKAAVEVDAAAVVAARDAAKTASGVAKSLAEKSEVIEERLKAYEERLAELDKQAAAQLDEITRLLPGATAAGLAHSFDKRRQTFLEPAVLWQRVFVGSVAAIVLLALGGLWHAFRAGAPLSYDELLRLWLARLPIAGALIWLALHASREAALAKRLEEDYGYKAAIASSFQGFQKQMADIGTLAPEGSPLSKLCDDTLATIASPPGRIYDQHKLTVSPAGELAEAARAAAGDRPAGK